MVISINNFGGHSLHVIHRKSQIWCGIHEFIDPSVCSYNRYWPAVHLSLVRQDKISSGKALACFYSRVKTSQILGNGKVSFFGRWSCTFVLHRVKTWLLRLEYMMWKRGLWRLGRLEGLMSSRIRPPCSSSSPSRQGWTRQILLGKESWGQFIALRLQSWLRMHYCIACISVIIKVPGHDINFFRSTRKSSKTL